jgi:hypothetical protein
VEMSTLDSMTFHCIQLVQVLWEVVQSGAMRGVTQPAVLLTAHLVAMSALTQHGCWDLALSCLDARMGRARVRGCSLLASMGMSPFLLL